MELSASTNASERALLFGRAADGYDVPEVDDRPEVADEYAWLFRAYGELRTEAVYVSGGMGGAMRLAIPVTRINAYLDQHGVSGEQREFSAAVLIEVDARALSIEGEIAERRARREQARVGSNSPMRGRGNRRR